ncbi:MAG: substrate-binding domain-containing protein [Clostridiales bacterium]|jgi:phosphate transport system substrate-binding protein|nr:substrate-binding domain-containing protein [Clostridiales bacterium]
MRKFTLSFFLLSCIAVFTGCGRDDSSYFDASKEISVVSREEGSGTRGAFVELLGVRVKGKDGSEKDMTTKEAFVAKQTDVVMTNISGDRYAIGYISMGSMNDTVKSVAIDGATASADSVKSGDYPLSRPFYLATQSKISDLARDFMDFIISYEGQAVVGESYVPIDENAAYYSGKKPAGRIVVAGSSSVTPVMESLKEAYIAVNPAAVIEIQQSDSSAGMVSAMEGTCDIGMTSRELKEGEIAKLTPTQIAVDAITVIVNRGNPVEELTSEQVKDMFTGEIMTWNSVL